MHNSVGVIRRRDWVEQPWKNGGGITHELARDRGEGAFRWRLSVAKVSEAGPFSSFPGVDRTIALVQGRGFRLIRDQISSPRLEATVTSPGHSFSFHGEDSWRCELIAGEVLDFNLMVRRGEARGEMWNAEVGGEVGISRAHYPLRGAEALFLLVLGAEAKWEIDGNSHLLEHLDAVLVRSCSRFDFGDIPCAVLGATLWQSAGN
jgi:environmental stress-induced protein Ves